MLVDYKCNNDKCKNFLAIIQYDVKMSDLTQQVCKKCGNPVQRVWNSTTAIRTSDGYKS